MNEQAMDDEEEFIEESGIDTETFEAAQKEAAEFKDKFVRAVAEMENLRKRSQRDIEDAGKYGVISSAKPFLSVADNLARAMDAIPADLPDTLKTFLEGIRATQRELKAALDRMGIVNIVAEAGQPLNPHEHEVMFEVNTEDQPNGTIVQVLEAGYKIHDRLLRPARVSVAKNTISSDKAMDVSA